VAGLFSQPFARIRESANSRFRWLAEPAHAGQMRRRWSRRLLDEAVVQAILRWAMGWSQNERPESQLISADDRGRRTKVKPIKISGLAVLAALMAMAIAGASPAMATSTQLCAVDASPCSSAVTHVHETTLAGSPMNLLSSLGNVTCDVLFLSTSVGGLRAPQLIEGNFTYTNCKRITEVCTVTEIIGPSLHDVLKEGHETASVTVGPTFKVKCGPFINCTFFWEVTGTAKGPLLSTETNGQVSIIGATPFATSGILCPGASELDIVTTPLSATYISS
jgi:hypothetical protein